MKKELYSHFIYLSSLFKTTELKISTSNNLEVNEISAIGSVHHKIDLTDAYLKVQNTQLNKHNHILITSLLIVAGSISLFQFTFPNRLEFILTLLSFSLILSSMVLLFLKSKSKRIYSLHRSSNNQFMYKFSLDADSSNNDEIKDFVDELTKRISKDDNLDSVIDVSSHQNNTEEQYNNLIYNLECLYNSGVVDDTTFDRIDSNINEKLYPNENKDNRHIAEVIYLHNNNFAHKS